MADRELGFKLQVVAFKADVGEIARMALMHQILQFKTLNLAYPLYLSGRKDPKCSK